MTLSRISPLVLAVPLVLSGCDSSGPGQSGSSFNPPNTEFATQLGITPPPPVTRDQAMAIAAEAAGGTAESVDQESEGGEVLYEVQVRTASGRLEVEVRASDGGVVEIEPADGD